MSSSARALLDAQRIARASKAPPAASAAKSAAAEFVPPTQETLELPAHIIACVADNKKLNAQSRYFKCPAWADLPSEAFHLACTRDGRPLAPLGLQRYPYYLLGKNAQVCDYILDHPSISGVHAAIVFHKPHKCFVLVDLNSTNGSRVNDRVVEKAKPVPIPVGSVLRFGHSARRYELRAGPPPPSSSSLASSSSAPLSAVGGKRPRSDSRDRQADAASGGGKRATTEKATAVEATRTTEGHDGVNDKDNNDGEDSDSVFSFEEELADGKAETATAAADDKPAQPQGPERLHLFQLVIKHKDVENPVSRGRNKGETITRSRDDAVRMAESIIRMHDAGEGARAPVAVPGGGGRTYVPWTVEEFVECVKEYCEVSNPKKKGDLGVVERGTFMEEFDRAAFALQREEVSAPTETVLGIHLIYRCD